MRSPFPRRTWAPHIRPSTELKQAIPYPHPPPPPPPIRQQPRRTCHWKRDEIGRPVTDFLQQGKVKELSSPWSSPVVLVTKRIIVRGCVLNGATVKDAFKLTIHSLLYVAQDGFPCSILTVVSGKWQWLHLPRKRQHL